MVRRMSPVAQAPNVVANFRADYVAAIKELLSLAGVRVGKTVSDGDVSRAYWNTQLRLVEPRPRAVHLSSNLTNFGNSQGVSLLQKKFEAGENVNAHQSKALLNSEHRAFHDLLFNDWGIQHFHLGAALEPSGFVNRTGDLLFAVVRPDDVYFITVLPHGAWVELGMLETIHTNWPDLLPRAVGVSGRRLTEDQMRTLRKKHFNFFPQVSDGTTYFPAGGGYMVSGVNARVQVMSDRCFAAAEDYQAAIERDADSIASQILDESGKKVGSPMRVSLLLKDGEAFALETNVQVRFRLGPFPPPL